MKYQCCHCGHLQEHHEWSGVFYMRCTRCRKQTALIVPSMISTEEAHELTAKMMKARDVKNAKTKSNRAQQKKTQEAVQGVI